jgi:geranylgeranyl pyrophosphate synthase
VKLPRDDRFAEGVVDRLRELAATLVTPLAETVAAFADRPGKMLRSHLVEVCSRLGESGSRRTVRLGAVVELLHIASLLHDDVIDGSVMRRGLPAAHVVAGHEMAVLAGAATLALAGQEAAELGHIVSGALSDTAAELSLGELLDVERAFDTTVEVSDYVELAKRKTGALFRLSCVLGAASARADVTLIESVGAFGEELGVAFQIADDCLDFRSDTDKPVGTDHMMGLFGLPTLCALRGGATELQELLLSPVLTVDDLPTIRSLVADAGGVDAAMVIAQHHYKRAISALEPLAETDTGRVLTATAEVAWQTWP